MKVSGYTLLKDLFLGDKVQVGEWCVEQVQVSIFVDSPGRGKQRQMNTRKQQNDDKSGCG